MRQPGQVYEHTPQATLLSVWRHYPFHSALFGTVTQPQLSVAHIVHEFHRALAHPQPVQTQAGPAPNHLLIFNKLLGVSAGEPLLLSAPVRDGPLQAAGRCSTLDGGPTHVPPARTPAAVCTQVQSEQGFVAAEAPWRNQHNMGGEVRRVIGAPDRGSAVAHDTVIADEAAACLIATGGHRQAHVLDTRSRVGAEVELLGMKADSHHSLPQVQVGSSPSVAAVVAGKHVSAGRDPLGREKAVRGLARRHSSNAPKCSQTSHLRKGFIQFPATSTTTHTEEVSEKAFMKRFSEDEADSGPGCAKRARWSDPLELPDDEQSDAENDMDDGDYVPSGATAASKPSTSRRKAAAVRVQGQVQRRVGRPKSRRTQCPNRTTFQRGSPVSDLSDSSQSSRASFDFSDGRSSTERRSSVSSPLTSVSSQDSGELDDIEAEC